jgi:hypothetical protein
VVLTRCFIADLLVGKEVPREGTEEGAMKNCSHCNGQLQKLNPGKILMFLDPGTEQVIVPTITKFYHFP